MYRNIEIFSLGLDDFVTRFLDAFIFHEGISNSFNPSMIHIILTSFHLPDDRVKQIKR